ncbi:52 kDa repressor of the inhibitor of the protein kinase-like [Diabrotica undecimpunctata]|uniref:52 kDa repressor of the inhibitor of the protein kinase-like n=1 Tax=Diabrotica undecimpunctata TaxID=50387 RepID=UPI003B638CBF
MIRAFNKYKDVNTCCKDHAKNQYNKIASEAAEAFLTAKQVDIQINEFASKTIETNRKVLFSVILCIVFSGSHDLPLRGKESSEGVFQDLCIFRIDAGDKILQEHFEHGAKNTSYKSVRIQNEIIDICGHVIRREIFEKIKKANYYAILADETADISGKEQLSIGLRYFDEEAEEIREKFTGFVQLDALNAPSIANANLMISRQIVKLIHSNVSAWGLMVVPLCRERKAEFKQF